MAGGVSDAVKTMRADIHRRREEALKAGQDIFSGPRAAERQPFAVTHSISSGLNDSFRDASLHDKLMAVRMELRGVKLSDQNADNTLPSPLTGKARPGQKHTI